MIAAIRLIGLACIVAAGITLAIADTATLIALGCAMCGGLCCMGFALCVFAGCVSRQDMDEVDELNHPDNVGNKN